MGIRVQDLQCPLQGQTGESLSGFSYLESPLPAAFPNAEPQMLSTTPSPAPGWSPEVPAPACSLTKLHILAPVPSTGLAWGREQGWARSNPCPNLRKRLLDTGLSRPTFFYLRCSLKPQVIGILPSPTPPHPTLSDGNPGRASRTCLVNKRTR